MIEQSIYQGLRRYMQAYRRIDKKKKRQLEVLNEIGGKGAERLKKTVHTDFDDALRGIQRKNGATVRHYTSKIQDETSRSQVRYLVNMVIRHPEKYSTEKEFTGLCDEIGKIFSSEELTYSVNKPP